MYRHCIFGSVRFRERLRYLCQGYLEVEVFVDEEDVIDGDFRMTLYFKPANRPSFKKMVREEME